VVVFDRGRVGAPRAFTARDEALVYATLQRMGAERVEVVEAASADDAVLLARRRV
jgi:hypothetical protein